jgi:hypothetical protein
MPTFIPSYVYTLFASLIVGTLIIAACGMEISNLKREAEQQQLSNIAGYVTSESMDLLSGSQADNFTASTWLNLPSDIAGQAFWVQLDNDSATAWVNTGFGVPVGATENCVFIPSDVYASGTFTSGSGRALLQCYANGTGVHLTITGAN